MRAGDATLGRCAGGGGRWWRTNGQRGALARIGAGVAMEAGWLQLLVLQMETEVA